MANNIAFQPLGKTYVVAGNGTIGVTVAVLADSPSNQFDFYNNSNNIAYIAIGSSANVTTAGVPAVGSPSYGWPLPGGQRVIRSGLQSGQFTNVTVSVASIGGNTIATVFITPGEGIS